MTLANNGLTRYSKFIPYLTNLSNRHLNSIAYSEQYVVNIAIPQFITLYQQAGGDIDKKLNELGVTIDDILGLRLRFLQLDNPHIEIERFVPYVTEYYNMLNYKPEDLDKHIIDFFSKRGIDAARLRAAFEKAYSENESI